MTGRIGPNEEKNFELTKGIVDGDSVTFEVFADGMQMKVSMKLKDGKLEGVVQARAHATGIQVTPETLKDPAAFEKFQQAQAGLTSALGRLIAIAENYPNLKADQNFRDLQSQLEGTENRIAVARKRYIEKVAEYNKGVRYFPTNLTAKFLLHMEEKPNFAVADEKAVAKPPEVKFN